MLGLVFLSTLLPCIVGNRWRDREERAGGSRERAGGSRLVAWVKGWGGGQEVAEREPLLRGEDDRGNSYS